MWNEVRWCNWVSIRLCEGCACFLDFVFVLKIYALAISPFASSASHYLSLYWWCKSHNHTKFSCSMDFIMHMHTTERFLFLELWSTLLLFTIHCNYSNILTQRHCAFDKNSNFFNSDTHSFLLPTHTFYQTISKYVKLS